MAQITVSPAKYIQGRGEIARLGAYCAQLGAINAFVIVDSFVVTGYGPAIAEAFAAADVGLTQREFTGECSLPQVQRLVDELQLSGAEAVVGIGGGKTLDTAKAVSRLSGLPVVIVPTVASTDAPCSALSVLYTEDGVLDRYLPLLHSPDLVVADVDIIAKAPPRLLAAGMGDALSTYYEARACRCSGALTHAGGTGSIAAYALARACLDTLLQEGTQALADVRAGEVTAAVEHIIEANIYLSGIGFESGGLAAAHAVHNGLTVLPECARLLHGEKVAFATLVQLELEGAPEAEIREAADFCRSAGLPVTLQELGLADAGRERLMFAAEAACAADGPMSNMPFAVTPADVYTAIAAADRRHRAD
ncbi:glycerol dehydrogenase ['Paenibacillus yunnanensis' Narsing Rao et al. 2020]|uniref:glycerol dehydrogenase n=1 Tax=Paenibacillus tengchongensis TaxID=2608684 RepID=UPI00124E4E75|nr:glycerol dehydrogenase [Paenibacillus tengchongensis]